VKVRRDASAQECEKLRRVRHAVAEEFAAKLPPLMTLAQFARLTGKSHHRIRAAAARGEIFVTRSPEGARISPADNLHFLMRAQLLVLPLGGTVPDTELRSDEPAADRREVSVSAAAYELLWERAVEARTSPEAVLESLISS
jgi:hypothetical protein